MTIGEALQVASNFHGPDRPSTGVWFAATLDTPAATPVTGEDAVAVGWFKPGAPAPLALPTDAHLLAHLARRSS